jgi:hypothetical protein
MDDIHPFTHMLKPFTRLAYGFRKLGWLGTWFIIGVHIFIFR